MYFSGQNGKLEVALDYGGAFINVGSLKNWSYTTQQQTLETTCLQDVDKTQIHGIRSTTGQASLLYYETDSDSNWSNAKLLGSRLIREGEVNNPSSSGYGTTADTPERVLIKLTLPGGRPGNNKREVAMWAYVTSFAMTCSVGEVVSADIAWEAIGAPFAWEY